MIPASRAPTAAENLATSATPGDQDREPEDREEERFVGSAEEHLAEAHLHAERHHEQERDRADRHRGSDEGDPGLVADQDGGQDGR